MAGILAYGVTRLVYRPAGAEDGTAGQIRSPRGGGGCQLCSLAVTGPTDRLVIIAVSDGRISPLRPQQRRRVIEKYVAAIAAAIN